MKSTNPSELSGWLDKVLAGFPGSTTIPENPYLLQELAIIDVREPGQFGEGHLFFAVPIPFSVFEFRFTELVPRLSTCVVLIDQGDGVSERAASAASAIGYTNVYVLTGGVKAWQEAGFTLFKGVNVPSKTFGELLEIKRKTPHISAEELSQRRQSGESLAIIDGRPASEYHNMSIPGAGCCPNGELVLRADTLVDNPETLVVINCAGRTRSILGAQSLIDAGFPNPVVALENGTQGWVLAGLQLEHGVKPAKVDSADAGTLEIRRERLQQLAATAGVEFIDAGKLAEFHADHTRTLYLLDVRSLDEFQSAALQGSRHAPGGQLVQATDQWVGVRGARIVLLDSEGLRATMCAYWLRQLGHEAFVMQSDDRVENLISDSNSVLPATTAQSALQVNNARSIPTVQLTEVGEQVADVYQIIDIRPSAEYRATHIRGAQWSVRSRITRIDLDKSKTVLLVGNPLQVELVISDLQAEGFSCCWLAGSGEAHAVEEWKRAGVAIAKSGTSPADEERIDFLFFTAGRHKGSRADSLLYLQWEQDLLNQIGEQERNSFHLV